MKIFMNGIPHPGCESAAADVDGFSRRAPPSRRDVGGQAGCETNILVLAAVTPSVLQVDIQSGVIFLARVGQTLVGAMG